MTLRLAAFAFVLVILAVTPAAAQQSAPAAPQGDKSESEFGKGAYRDGEPGLVMPVIQHRKDPFYPPAAMREKIEGEVQIEAVVREDGTVGEVRVIKSLDTKFGLDDSAVAAVKAWVFKPGHFSDGLPVPVICLMVMEFRLH